MMDCPMLLHTWICRRTNHRKKTSFSFKELWQVPVEREMGYEPEFMRNMLSLTMVVAITKTLVK